MTENDDAFIVQVVIPAVRREQILLYVHESILTIVVLQKDFEPFPNSKAGQLRTGAGNTERHILLPPGADTEFVSAEYKRGILQIFVPKSINPSRVQERQIVVY